MNGRQVLVLAVLFVACAAAVCMASVASSCRASGGHWAVVKCEGGQRR